MALLYFYLLLLPYLMFSYLLISNQSPIIPIKVLKKMDRKDFFLLASVK